jgi:F-type H+-transporting ATPase subunit a
MDPLHQFNIVPILPIAIGGYDLSFGNSALFTAITGLAVFALVHYGMKSEALIPGRLQSAAEMAYEFVAGLVQSNAGPDARPFVPMVFTLFMFILFANLLGMLPYTFTVTSHIIVTFALGAAVFVGVTVLGFARHGLRFFSLFMPPGAPLALAPLMVPIELVLYLMRPVSLAIRLFVNIMAGHMMMKVFAGFVVMLIGALGASGAVIGLAPIMVNVALTAFEFLVAFLQAYVFTILTCIYIHDSLALH